MQSNLNHDTEVHKLRFLRLGIGEARVTVDRSSVRADTVDSSANQSLDQRMTEPPWQRGSTLPIDA